MDVINTVNGASVDNYGIFEGNDSTKKLTLGYDGTGHSNDYFGHHSEYAEILVFDRALTSSEEAIVNGYLSSKWNLTSVMDSDGDGVADADEIIANTSIVDATSIPVPPVTPIIATYFEDFEGYTSGDINGQDGWIVTKRNTGGSTLITENHGPGGSQAIRFPYSGAGVGNRIYKKFSTSSNPFALTTGVEGLSKIRIEIDTNMLY